jgi:glycine/D-amino acid oxidase-like deaminating enzyme
MTKPVSELTPKEAEARRKYSREWAKKNKQKKAAAAAAAAPPAAAPTVLKIAPLRNGGDPGEALFYISDTLANILAELKKIAQACEKAGGM